MQDMTTTDLRTKSSQLVKTLKNGDSVNLIHHSKVVGQIKPKQEGKVITKKAIEDLKRLAKKINLPKITYRQREKIYRQHLKEKYGTGLS